MCVCVRARVHARERACVPSCSFKIVWILVCFFFVAYIMTVFITALYIGYAAMCDGRGGFHILWIWFPNCTAFYGGCKPHIVLILSGVIWCRYVALYAYGVFSFTYVMNFIVIIDLTRCCFLHYGALALFGWAGVAGTVTCAVDIVEGFMLSIFVLLTGLRYAHFWCAVIQYFSRPAVMFFHLIFCPHHFSTQTDAPAQMAP